jgi:di- and tripeptidase
MFKLLVICAVVEAVAKTSIQAWSLETYDLVLSVHAHKESVLGLYLSDDGNLLFSSGGDSVINVSMFTRHTEQVQLIYW